MKAFQFVLLVLAEQQRCSIRVHGGVAAWLRQRMTAMWQILQVTKVAADCTQPVKSSSMPPFVSCTGQQGAHTGPHTCQLFSHTLCCSVSATRGLWYQLLGGVCAYIMTALSTSMHSMIAREESKVPQLGGSRSMAMAQFH